VEGHQFLFHVGLIEAVYVIATVIEKFVSVEFHTGRDAVLF
jgi:hypothetical protein